MSKDQTLTFSIFPNHLMSAHQENSIPLSPWSHTFASSVKSQQGPRMRTSRSSMISSPTRFDILLGKDSSVYNHDGNRSFRSIIYNHIYEYLAAPTKASKSKIVQDVHACLQKSGYRFLRKINDNRGFGSFMEITIKEARQKIAHALRDGTRERQKKTPSHSTVLVDASSALVKIISEETRRPPPKSSKRKTNIALTSELLMNTETKFPNRQGNELQVRYPRNAFDKMHKKSSRVSLGVVHENGAINHRKGHRRHTLVITQAESLLHNVTPERNYSIQSKNNGMAERKQPCTIVDEEFKDYEPLDPSIENGFIYSCSPRSLANYAVDDINVDQFLSVVRSL